MARASGPEGAKPRGKRSLGFECPLAAWLARAHPVMDAAGIEALREQFLDGLATKAASAGSQKERPPLDEMYDAVMGFVHAIDWTDPFIIGIVAAIVTLYVVVFATRKHVDAQIALLAVVCAVAYAAPHASRALGPYWQQLARQDYFDKHGYFGSMLVSLPLMVLALIQMVSVCAAAAYCWLPALLRVHCHRLPLPAGMPVHPRPQGMAFCSASTLLVQYKRKQLRVDGTAAAKPDKATKEVKAQGTADSAPQGKTGDKPKTE